MNIRSRLRPPDFGTPGYEDTVFQTGVGYKGGGCVGSTEGAELHFFARIGDCQCWLVASSRRPDAVFGSGRAYVLRTSAHPVMKIPSSRRESGYKDAVR
ncbi:MAG: hypothetical protein IKP37_08400 [Paludibacteraceae bacterium]|nr:hypothetical protein [Paludibacteraceae bacterium]